MARYELFLTRLPEVEGQWLHATLARFPPQLNRDMLTRALQSRQVPKAAIAWADEPGPIHAIHAHIVELGGEAFVYEQSTWLQRVIDPIARALGARRRASAPASANDDRAPPKLASFQAVAATSKRVRRALYVIGFALFVVAAGLVLQRWTEAHAGFSSGLAGISKLRHAVRSRAALQDAGKGERSAVPPAPAPSNAKAPAARSQATNTAAHDVGSDARTAGPHSSSGRQAIRAVARGLGSELAEAKWLFVALALGLLAARLFVFGLRWIFADGVARWYARGAALLAGSSACAAFALLEVPEAALQPKPAAARAAVAARATPPATGKPFAGLLAELRHRHAEQRARSRAQTAALAATSTLGAGSSVMARSRAMPSAPGRSVRGRAVRPGAARERHPDKTFARGSSAAVAKSPPIAHERGDEAALSRALVREVASQMAGPTPTPAQDIVPGDDRALIAWRAVIKLKSSAPAPIARDVRAERVPVRVRPPAPRVDDAGPRARRIAHGARVVGLSMLLGLASMTLFVWKRRRDARARSTAPRAAALERDRDPPISLTGQSALACPQCGARYPLETAFCGNDGQPLRPAP